jgi:hypothetical protein
MVWPANVKPGPVPHEKSSLERHSFEFARTRLRGLLDSSFMHPTIHFPMKLEPIGSTVREEVERDKVGYQMV